MIDFLPPHEALIVVDDNPDYVMYVDKQSIDKEVYVVEGESQTYISAWIYVKYHSPYIPMTLDPNPSKVIAFNKYQTLIDCHNNLSMTPKMYNYDIDGNLIAEMLISDIQYSDFKSIKPKSIGAIQAKIICEGVAE